MIDDFSIYEQVLAKWKEEIIAERIIKFSGRSCMKRCMKPEPMK